MTNECLCQQIENFGGIYKGDQNRRYGSPMPYEIDGKHYHHMAYSFKDLLKRSQCFRLLSPRSKKIVGDKVYFNLY